MTHKAGRKRSISHEAVVQYATEHPTMNQRDIAGHFHTSQQRVSAILRKAGIYRVYRGRLLKQKLGQSDEEHHWELILQEYGLGLDRGLRLNSKRIFYGYDPAKEDVTHESVTANNGFQPLAEDC